MGAPPTVADTPLGKTTDYVTVYTPSLLSPIPRSASRQALGVLPDSLPFTGTDVWNAYELSWLDEKGKPVVALGRLSFPCNTPFLVESKSLKLYLNSLNQTRFSGIPEVIRTLKADLSRAAGGPVEVAVMSLAEGAQAGPGRLSGENIDKLTIEVNEYRVNPDLLRANGAAPPVRETLCSDLLRSNCPVTGQPDWGSVAVSYRGAPMDRAGLLKYVISFREHEDFHENCVERMFVDIMERCKPEALTVSARYTRRGGLDINPWRTNGGEPPPEVRLVRQ